MPLSPVTSVAVAVLVLAGLGGFLAVLLVLAEKRLVQSGPVKLVINDADPMKVPGGEPLLGVLRDQKIFVPSACGGRGSCGLCKVRIPKGGGPLLPTEVPHLTEVEIAEKIRLSCQVKVRRDLSLEIPAWMLEVEERPVRVEHVEDINYDTRRVRLTFDDDGPFTFKAGQYVQIETPIYDGLGEPVYRAYSVSSPPHDPSALELIIRKIPRGICTTYVHELLEREDRLLLNGPYGDFYLRETPAPCVFIAGGSGLAPFESILADMVARGIEKEVTLFFGAVARRDLYDVALLDSYAEKLEGFRFVPALSAPESGDEWDGRIGLVTEVVAEHFVTMEGMEAYLCGSPGMIDACVEVLLAKGVAQDRIYYDKFA